jgi:LruC domain-containing protein
MKKVLLILLPVFLFSCSPENLIGPEGPGKVPTATESFDFKTTDQVSLDLVFGDMDGAPFKGIPVEIWNADPFKGGEIIFKGFADENGQFQAELVLPASQTEVVVSTGQIGLKDNVIVPVLDGKVFYQTFGYDTESDFYEQEFDANGNPARRLTSGPVLHYMGSYNSSGLPDYLEPTRDVISAELLTLISSSLPEGKPVPTWHPRYLDSDKEININIVDTADVWMTFVHEGAGWRNALGYYTYPTSNPPNTIDDLDSLHVIFPNASLSGSGGAIVPGDKVNLGRFEPGTSLGIVLFANAWNGSVVGDGYYKIWTSKLLNPEVDALNQQHHVLLYDEENELFLIGLEDINREQPGCDQDFNDAVFYLTSNPVTAISTEDVAPIDKPGDTDEDGVSDVYDDYPEDPNAAYRVSYPSASSYGTLAFEDLWPQMGDYDFNDLVSDYRYTFQINAQNQVSSMQCEFVIKAIGAGIHNGFGFEMEVAPSAIASVTGSELHDDYITVSSNGTEASQSKAVIIVSDDVYEGFTKKGGFINTVQEDGYLTPDTIRIEVTFNSSIAYSSLGSAPFNPFLIVDKDRGHEVHLPSYSPTDLMDLSLFNTYDDGSNTQTGMYFVSPGNLPWGMNLPVEFAYPQEKSHIATAHEKFTSWVSSGGFSFMDWYEGKTGYRNNAKIYSKE